MRKRRSHTGISVGTITIGNVSISDILSTDLYRMVKVVPQEDELLNCSLLENMNLATSKVIGEEDVTHALMLADAWDFVKVCASIIVMRC